MSNMTKVIIGIVLPFLGTTLGSATVFFLKKEMNSKLQNLLRGFAAGVMIAASVWSLLIPSIDMAEAAGKTAAWLPAVVGFLIGIGFMLLLDSLIPHLHTNSARPEGRPSAMGKNLMLMLAVTLHNIPEGMAVGLSFARAAQHGGSRGLVAAAGALALGIGVQNFPEGAAVALPVYQSGKSKRRAFWTGVLSGAVEPLFGALVVLAAAGIHALMPWLLSFAAGAMLYVVAEELLPRAGGRRGTCGFLLGFLLMMILDVALG